MADVAAPPGDETMAGSAQVRDKHCSASARKLGSAVAMASFNSTQSSHVTSVERHHNGRRSGSIVPKEVCMSRHCCNAGSSDVTAMRTRSACISDGDSPTRRSRASMTRVAVLTSVDAMPASSCGPTVLCVAISAPATAAAPPRRAMRAHTAVAKDAVRRVLPSPLLATASAAPLARASNSVSCDKSSASDGDDAAPERVP